MLLIIGGNRNQIFLFPPSVNGWLPDDHQARFIVEIVEQLDISSLKNEYGGRGSVAYYPKMMVALLFYSYATGVFSSRKIERSTYDSVAFRCITGNTHPDHDTIATFRRRFLTRLKKIFIQILQIAHEMKILRLGAVSIDGTKIQASVSKHKALSYGHACKLELLIEQEIAALLENEKITPYIAVGRVHHHQTLEERFSQDPPALPHSSDPKTTMSHRLMTKIGKTLYAARKSTIEPVFGIIKHVMGFRQFSFRGLERVQGEWDLVALAWNVKRMHILAK